MKTIAIIPPGTLPIPPINGGAVENLIFNLCRYNESVNNVKLVVFSIYNSQAKLDAQKFRNCEFFFIRIPRLVKRLDQLTYLIMMKVVGIDRASSFRFLWQRLFYIKEVAKEINTSNFHRVILENHASLLWVLRLHHNYQKYAGKIYYHMHNKINSFYGCKNIFLQLSGVIGVSNYIISTLSPEIRGKLKTSILRNKIDENKFLNIDPKEVFKFRNKYQLEDKKVVLFTGRFNREKGIDKLLIAWQKLKPKNAVLLIVGAPYYKSGMSSSFENKMHNLTDELKQSVKFTGFVDYRDMPIIYSLADVVVLPSIWNDPAPLTVIEAITANKPLITTNSGGIPEYAKEYAVILQRDQFLIDNLMKSIKMTLNSPSTSLKRPSWHFSEYYHNFLKLINIGE